MLQLALPHPLPAIGIPDLTPLNLADCRPGDERAAVGHTERQDYANLLAALPIQPVARRSRFLERPSVLDHFHLTKIVHALNTVNQNPRSWYW